MREPLVDSKKLTVGFVGAPLFVDGKVIIGSQGGGGVALALRGGVVGISGFQDVSGRRVGVMTNSLAGMLLNKRGANTVPYSFESDMVADPAKDELEACAVSPAAIRRV